MNRKIFVVSQHGDKMEKNVTKVAAGQQFVFINGQTYGVYDSAFRASEVARDIIHTLLTDEGSTVYEMPER